MHTDDRLSLQRIDRLRRDRVEPARYRATAPLQITAWTVPGEPVPFEVAAAQEFAPVAVGDAWGRPWGTVWFRVQGAVPAEWAGQDAAATVLVADLGFVSSTLPGFQAEGLVFRPDGHVVKAVEPRNREVRVVGDRVDLFVEAAANPNVAGEFTFEPTPYGDLATAGEGPLYRLERLELALLDLEVWELDQDLTTLRGLVDVLEPDRTRRARVVQAMLDALDALDPDDVAGTAARARAELAGVLASPASATAHRVTAVGHAHIDSAWLWPARETVRKVARTFSNVLELIESDDEFVFAASSAQQYAWLEEHYPALFARVADAVRAGRFVPVGGMWVESDTNLPGGESLARQLVAGKRFFLDRFGVEPREVWLPDSFGYSAAMPQLLAAAGSRWFLTQKISWNETNRMPHHSFLWEGIDGTRVFTHFPPVDSYSSDLSAADLARAERQYADKRHAGSSLVPFGWGDGGGGPTREMIAQAHRTADLEGSPRVRMASPAAFFADAEAEYAHPPVWSGELYLEYHRGCYSAQARTKRGNRRSEHLLREAELWATAATVRTGAEYPYERLERAWRTVLLQQFHDILPGSSIAWVHREAERRYEEVREDVEDVIGRALAGLGGETGPAALVNGAPVAVGGVPAMSAAPGAAASVPSLTVAERGHVLAAGSMRWTIGPLGLVVSAVDQTTDRELVDPAHPAGALQLLRDTPRDWDAWNIDREDSDLVAEPLVVDDVAVGDDGASVVVRRHVGRTSIVQTYRVAGTGALEIRVEVDWHERQKMLKLAFPLALAADTATSEIQFGHLSRPTHANTSWDAARFETVAQRWMLLDEGAYRVCVANDASYGHDVRRGGGTDGGHLTIARVTLVRGPLFPDPTADEGRHEFTVSLLPGAGVADAIAEGFRLNLPLREATGAIAPFVEADEGVVVEAVKLADDRSGDVIVRLYEAFGSFRRARVRPGFAWRSVEETDLLERTVPTRAVRAVNDGVVHLELGRFQIATLRFVRVAGTH